MLFPVWRGHFWSELGDIVPLVTESLLVDLFGSGHETRRNDMRGQNIGRILARRSDRQFCPRNRVVLLGMDLAAPSVALHLGVMIAQDAILAGEVLLGGIRLRIRRSRLF